MFDTNQDDSETFERDALARDNEGHAACECCGWLTCPQPDDCTTVLRLCRENDAVRAETGLPPFLESTEEQDAALLRDPYAVTCHCGADATHSDEAYGYCEEHAPADAYAAVF